MDHSHLHHGALVLDLTTLDVATLITIFSMSFLSSLHCAFTCAPLVCSQLGPRAVINHPGLWLYNGGRIVSYAGMGALVGQFQATVMHLSKVLGQTLALGLGILILASAVLAFFAKNWADKFPRGLAQRLFRKTQLWPSTVRDTLLGVVTVFLPCATLTPTLLAATTTGRPLTGALVMATFAAGTLPVMLSATYVPNLIFRRIPRGKGRQLVPIMLLIVGIITIYRAVGGHG